MPSGSIYTWAIAIVLAVVLPSCGPGNSPDAPITDTSGASPVKTVAQRDTSLDNTVDIDTTQYATVFLVVADTGQDYYSLRDKMKSIATAHKWKIDTMGRYYNKKRKEIVLPDDDPDEIYRGEYIQRRDRSKTLSLEYYRSYSDQSTAMNIALVTAICDDEHEADSLAAIAKQNAPGAFVHKTRLYIGCMH